ncbi:hypothetical protein OB13_14550 [Pontibacter sp. HJ8]
MNTEIRKRAIPGRRNLGIAHQKAKKNLSTITQNLTGDTQGRPGKKKSKKKSLTTCVRLFLHSLYV